MEVNLAVPLFLRQVTPSGALQAFFLVIAERGDRLFEVVGKQRGADRIAGLGRVVDVTGLRERAAPFAAIEIAARAVRALIWLNGASPNGV